MSAQMEAKLIRLVYLFAVMLGISSVVNFSVLILLIKFFYVLQRYLG